MRKKIVCILAAALVAVTLPLTADAKAGIRRGTDSIPAESVTVTAEMIRTDANKKNGSSETVPWDPEALRGKTFSILGDSISTYRNTSNRRGSRWSNTTIGRGAAWYSDLKPKLGEDETWWMQLSEDLGYNLDQCGFPHEAEEILAPMDLIQRYQEERASLNAEIDRVLAEITEKLGGVQP